MDREVIEQKLESLRRCLWRVAEKCPADPVILSQDPDLQDIVTLNLSRAVRLRVDHGAHQIAEMDVPPLDTMGQTFDALTHAGAIPEGLAQQLKKAVGFRNIAVHHNEAVNWTIVHRIAMYHLNDFTDFAKVVAARLVR